MKPHTVTGTVGLSRGGESALGGGDETCGGVQADGVAEEARDVSGFFGGDPKLSPLRFPSLHARLFPRTDVKRSLKATRVGFHVDGWVH